MRELDATALIVSFRCILSCVVIVTDGDTTTELN